MGKKSPIKQAAARQDEPKQSNGTGTDVEAALDNTQLIDKTAKIFTGVGLGASAGGLSALERHGYSESEALNMNSDKLIAARSLDEMNSVMQKLQKGKTSPPFESWCRHKDGHKFRVWLTTYLLADKFGQPEAIGITERELT